MYKISEIEVFYSLSGASQLEKFLRKIKTSPFLDDPELDVFDEDLLLQTLSVNKKRLYSFEELAPYICKRIRLVLRKIAPYIPNKFVELYGKITDNETIFGNHVSLFKEHIETEDILFRKLEQDLF